PLESRDRVAPVRLNSWTRVPCAGCRRARVGRKPMFGLALPRLTTLPLVLVLLAASFAPARAQQEGFAGANALVSQAKARLDQHRYDEAADLYRRALTMLERDPDKNRAYIIDTLSNLARTYEFQSRYVDAVDLRKRAVTLGEGTIGRDKGIGLAGSLN